MSRRIRNATGPSFYIAFLSDIENISYQKVVEQTGFEPISSVLQTAALTNFATVPLKKSVLRIPPLMSKLS